MRSKKASTSQLGFLAPSLEEQLNPKQELVLLSKTVDWSYFDQEFASLDFLQDLVQKRSSGIYR